MKNNDEVKKYFDPKEYITTIVGSGEEVVAPLEITGKKVSALISLLTDPLNWDVKEETLITLKKEKAGEILLAAIASPQGKANRHMLVAACWESEINFSKYLSFFITLALDADYLVSLEAITTIEEVMDGPFDKKTIEEGIIKIKEAQKNSNSERVVLLNDLVNTLQGYLNSPGK